MTIERWLPVAGYEGIYEVSDCGNVRRIGLTLAGKRPKRGNRKLVAFGGYIRIGLSDSGGITRQSNVHALVARAFIGVPPPNHEVNHKDGNGTNNFLGNLEYVTRAQNVRHSLDVLGRKRAYGVRCRAAKLTPNDIVAIRRLREEGLTYRAIAEQYNVTLQNISSITNRKYWKQVL